MPADALKTMPLDGLLRQMDNVAREAGRPAPRLLAVCKRQPATAVAELAHKWRRLREEKDEWVPAFGENYVQEAQAKQDELSGSGFPASELEWHLIGHLQSNKAKEAATRFDWIQTVDRLRLVDALARARPPERGPLNVLVQVNVDDESSKHGCAPDEIHPLAAAIAVQDAATLL